MGFLIYPSSAGSGKTYTLVKEYLKIALGSESPLNFSRILAITFTNKAANEMTDRILETLEEMGGLVTPMKKRSVDVLADLVLELGVPEEIIKERSRATLKKIVHNYRDFSVGTIDSFVHRVIRSFAQEMGLTQQFEVELNTENVLKRAVDSMLDRVGVDPILTEFIENYIDSKFETGNTWKIEDDLYGFAKGLLNTHHWKYLEKAKSVDLKTYSKSYSTLKQAVQEYQEHIKGIAQKAAVYALDGVPIKSYAYGGFFINFFNKILDGDFQPEVGPRMLGLLKEDSKWFSTTGKVDAELIEERRPKILEYFNQIDRYRTENESTYILNSLLYSNMFRVALLSEMDKEVQKIKSENDLVLISDFNALVGKVTRTEPVPFIYEKLGEKYNHFLFDEFQDTSMMQWHNMLPLVENSLSNGNTSMVVGDTKQSIYRWRGGVAEQFRMLPEVYNPDNDLFAKERQTALVKTYQETNSLNKNYRSFANIVKFNNSFFNTAAEVFEQSVSGFYLDVKQEIKDENSEGFINFQFYYDNKSEASLAVFEDIATLIQELQADGYNLNDIAILTKTKSETPDLVEFLHNKEIEVISSESLLVKNSSLVKLVVATLHHLNQPNENYYMSEILLRLNEINEISDFHRVMSREVEMSRSKFINTIQTWGYSLHRNKLLSLPLYEMVSGILESYSVNNSKDNRLAAWLNYVYEKSLKTGFGIFDLLEDWQLQSEKLSIQIPEDMNAVNIMTIHASKGLDWPVVILAQGNWQPKHKDHTFWVELPESNPIPAAILRHSSQVKQTMFEPEFEEEEKAIVLDNLNAMYVAFTRPEERLYVFSIKPKDGFFKDLLPVLNSITFPKSTPKFEEISKVSKAGKVSTTEELVSFSYGIAHPKTKVETKEKSNLIKMVNQRNLAYQTKLKVKKNYIKRLNDAGQRDFGNLVHKAFSFIQSVSDTELAISQLTRSGELPEADYESFKAHISKVILNPKVAPYFEEGVESKNEAEIILQSGDLMRPDRVVFLKNETVVIDFKTGMKTLEHEQQIIGYKIQLEKMGYENVKAVLIYTENVEVVNV